MFSSVAFAETPDVVILERIISLFRYYVRLLLLLRSTLTACFVFQHLVLMRLRLLSLLLLSCDVCEVYSIVSFELPVQIILIQE